MWVFGGFNYSKMANFDSRTYCNTFWMISRTSKNVTKSGPSDPVFITTIFQRIHENMGTSMKHIIFKSDNLTFWKFRNVCVPNFACSCVFDILKLWNLKFEIVNFEISKFQIPTFEIWSLYSLKVWNLETLKFEISKNAPGNDDDPRGIFFKILYINFISIKKHEMDIW